MLIYPPKGYKQLIPILEKLHKEGLYNWHFYLLGAGEMRDLYEVLIAKHNIKDKFTFLGYQENLYI